MADEASSSGQKYSSADSSKPIDLTMDKKRTSDQAFGDEEQRQRNKASPPKTAAPQSHPDGNIQQTDCCGVLTVSKNDCTELAKDGQAAKTTEVHESTPKDDDVTEAIQISAVENTKCSHPAVIDEGQKSDSADVKSARNASDESLIGSSTHISVDTPNVSEAENDEVEPATDYTVLADLIDTSARRCTYSLGYVKRQLVYACRTCTLDVLEPAGMCLACALNCHEDHDIVALLTRRNFRCDCGNTKYGPRRCQLTLNKDPTNNTNAYNNDFHGTICVCRKPIDSNAVGEEHDTVQCRLCEEQFHPAHIDVAPQQFGEDWDGELVCTYCFTKYPFLRLYAKYFAEPKSVQVEENKCVLAQLRKTCGEDKQSSCKSAFVFPAKWYEKLCKCSDCLTLYRTNHISFVLDPEDTCAAYEEREGVRELENVHKASQMGPEEIFAQIVEGFDPVTQVELAHWFNNLREVFVEFLRTRLEKGQTITETDIEEFFRSFGAQGTGEESDGSANI